MRRITRQRAVLLYGPAALALQVSHPLVAAGVRDHSEFAVNPIGRLRRTLDSTYRSVFHPPADAQAAVERVNRLHASVRGELRGQAYHALNPDLLLWVMATLVMSGIAAHERFIAPLSDADKAAFYADMRQSTKRFGLPLDYGPQSWEAFERYWNEQLTDPAFATDPTSREVARQITSPTRPWWHRPATPVARLWLIDTLPPSVAERLGFRRTAIGNGLAKTFAAGATVALRFGPKALRIVKAARVAERREQRLSCGATVGS